jgi:hypothetical protein
MVFVVHTCTVTPDVTCGKLKPEHLRSAENYLSISISEEGNAFWASSDGICASLKALHRYPCPSTWVWNLNVHRVLL